MLEGFKNILNSNNINNEFNYDEYNFIINFKKQKMENRISMCDKIILLHLNKLAIILDSKNIKLEKHKYIVPNNITIAQFLYTLRNRISLNSSESIFLFHKTHLIDPGQDVKIVYEKYKDEDGFLYLFVEKENVFG
jgi:GABA(A) receptor-associated protein